MNNSYAIDNSRTAGTMPVWGNPAKTPSNQPQDKASLHINNYAASSVEKSEASSFGFADLIDIINPLQHIPLVNIAYQKITGDEIKPISQILGGGVFGGVLGAGGALVNVAIKAETGKNIGEHAIAMVESDAIKQYNSNPRHDNPEDNINNALAMLEKEDASSAIAFADLRSDEYHRYDTKLVANGRTAGSFTQRYFDITANEPVYQRENITELRMNAMPARKEF